MSQAWRISRLLYHYLTRMGIPTAFGGTDTHIVIADVGKVPTGSKYRLTGDIVARILERVGISCNSNLIPGDKYVALSSGIRLGTTWISQLGYSEAEVREIAALIADICKGIKLYQYYGARREIPGGKVDEELLQSASQHVGRLLQQGNRPETFFEKNPDKGDSAQTHDAFPARGSAETRVMKHKSEALIVSGERSASFLQSIITRDIYKLKQGEAFPALVLYMNGEKRLDVVARCLSEEPRPCYLLTYQRDSATNLREWLQMLSDGFIEIEKDDPYRTLDGPVVIKSANPGDVDEMLLTTGGSEPSIELNKPYFIGQSALPNLAPANLPRERFSFEREPSGRLSRPSPLYDYHKESGATFTDYASYEVPLNFTSHSQEHEQVRRTAGLFDLSHRTLLGFRGQGAERFLDLVLTEHIPQLGTGESCRTCILSPEGTLISDCVLYRLEPGYFIMELEPVNAQMVEDWLHAVSNRQVVIDLERPGVAVDRSCRMTNLKSCSNPLLTLALQGPKSMSILEGLLSSTNSRTILHNLRKGQVTELSLSGVACLVARRGYTGELVGYELFVLQSKASFLWNALMDAGFDYSLRAIGLSAAESLRIESGLPLYGKDLAGTHQISPFEAGFGSAIKFDKPFFIGRQPMLSCSRTRRLVRLRAEIETPSQAELGTIILDEAGSGIGEITSAAFVSGRYFGLGQLAIPPEQGKAYLSTTDPLIPVEMIPVPYSAVIEA